MSDVEYPFHDRTITVTQCGRICIGRRKINLSGVFAGQNIGITEVSEKIWLVSFMNYDLGFFDHESGRVECAENPVGAKLLPNVPAIEIHPIKGMPTGRQIAVPGFDSANSGGANGS